MQSHGIGGSALAAVLLVLGACGERRHDGPLQVAGGETSEFSGGDVPLGYCPIEESRTALDLDRDDVAAWLALAAGQHTIDLLWRKEFPDAAIRGFEERTSLSLEVTPIAAEDVVCRTGGAGGYEAEGVDGSILRRFELGIELSSADGAVRAEYAGRFHPQRDGAGQRLLIGGVRLPFADVAGTLELGADAEHPDATRTLGIGVTFDGQTPRGSLESLVTLPGPVLGDDTPRWSPVVGTFPPPSADASCEVGALVPIDEILAPLGASPRAAYDAVRATFPSAPVQGIWVDELDGPGEVDGLPWAAIALRPSEPTQACDRGGSVDIYTSLAVDTADGRVHAEPPVIVTIGRALASSAAGDDFVYSLASTPRSWLPPAEFQAVAGVTDLELGDAEFAGFSLYQSFDGEHEQVQGDFKLVQWDGYFARPIERTTLQWCSGPRCDFLWCITSASSETDCE